MPKKIFIGRISLKTTHSTIQSVFGRYGAIVSSGIRVDAATGRSLGVADVEYATDAAGTAAIEGANGTVIDGSQVKVQAARE